MYFAFSVESRVHPCVIMPVVPSNPSWKPCPSSSPFSPQHGTVQLHQELPSPVLSALWSIVLLPENVPLLPSGCFEPTAQSNLSTHIHAPQKLLNTQVRLNFVSVTIAQSLVEPTSVMRRDKSAIYSVSSP